MGSKTSCFEIVGHRLRLRSCAGWPSPVRSARHKGPRYSLLKIKR
jgi:hypothetical protein